MCVCVTYSAVEVSSLAYNLFYYRVSANYPMDSSGSYYMYQVLLVVNWITCLP